MFSVGSKLDWKCTSAIREIRDSVERSGMPTACGGSCSQKVRTSAAILRENSTRSLQPSTADQERRSPGERQPKHSMRSCAAILREPLPPHRAPPSDASASDCTAVKILEVRCASRLLCDGQLNPGWDAWSVLKISGFPIFPHGLLQRLVAAVRRHGVRYPPGERLAATYIDNGHQIWNPCAIGRYVRPAVQT